nr:transposase [Nocardia jiangxiensis]
MGLEWGSSSWTLAVDAHRVPEGSCPVRTTADQIRAVADRVKDRQGAGERPAPLFVLDQGCAAAALTHALEGTEVQLLVRISGDRVFYDGRPGPRKPGLGRNGVHGQRFELAAPKHEREPDQLLIVPGTTKYGRIEVRAWQRMHQKVQRTGYFASLDAELFTRLPIIEGTVIEVRPERLPDGRNPHRALWLWHSGPHAPDLDVYWRAYLRRFDTEHTFRLLKSQLGWTAARVRHPEQAMRWTWLLIAVYAQLRLARTLTADLRRPWERRTRPGKPLTPNRVRRSFRHLHVRIGTPARLPKTTHPGPGRPPGRGNTPAPRYQLGSELRKTDMQKPRGEQKKG